MKGQNETLEDIKSAVAKGELGAAARMIEAAVRHNPAILAHGVGVWFAKVLILGNNWDLVNAILPKGTNALSTSGWLRSLATGVPVDAAGQALPWLTYPAIDFIEPRIDPGWKVFEWGSGYSTLWWSQRVTLVQSVENNAEWFKAVGGMVGPNCDLRCLPAGPDYVEAIAASPHAPFDVVCIDGVMRPECAAQAITQVRPTGIIIFDNSDVPDHEAGIVTLMDAGWKRIDFFGLIPAYPYKNCTSVFYKDERLVRVRTLPGHMKLSSGPTCTQALTRRR